jgi:DNA-binding SARP family transcriptional activator
MYHGRFDEAIRELRDVTSGRAILGTNYGTAAAALIEALFLAGHPQDGIAAVGSDLADIQNDKRDASEIAAAISVARHAMPNCEGSCVALATEILDPMEAESLATAICRVKIGVFRFEHLRNAAGTAVPWAAVRDVTDERVLRYLRWWLRMYVPHARTALREMDGAALLVKLLAADAEGWRPALTALLPETDAAARTVILGGIERYANPQTAAALREIAGDDVAAARRRMLYAQAPRLFVRTFGGISVSRGSWGGAEIRIDKKRLRALLGVLAGHAGSTLTREAAVDLLWPDADASAGVNNLNQTVFQLRRHLDPGYRAGESAEYIVSTADEIRFDDRLVRTDVAEVFRLIDPDGGERGRKADALLRVVRLIRGEFLADLRYEDWAAQLRLSVHSHVRRWLAPLLMDADAVLPPRLREDIARALLRLDPFDEEAVLHLANQLHASGQRVTARRLVSDFVSRTRDEFGDEPSPELARAAATFGVAIALSTPT